MENVVLAVHLIIALLLVGVVLLQRSEGGGLGMGGGGGGVMSGRGAATAMQKVTWALAICFIATSLTLTILAARGSSTASVLDQFGGSLPASEAPAPAASGNGIVELPPASTDAPATPPAAEAPATPPAAPAPAGN